MTPTRTIIHRSVIALFLALVAGVVYLQVSDAGKPIQASLTNDQAAAAAQTPGVCGDRICGQAETCGNCEQDCGQCKQAYCCQLETKTCDGPFGALTSNPCSVAGYDANGYVFTDGQDSDRQAAFQACKTACI